jgi:hypothetical protein
MAISGEEVARYHLCRSINVRSLKKPLLGTRTRGRLGRFPRQRHRIRNLKRKPVSTSLAIVAHLVGVAVVLIPLVFFLHSSHIKAHTRWVKDTGARIELLPAAPSRCLVFTCTVRRAGMRRVDDVVGHLQSSSRSLASLGEASSSSASIVVMVTQAQARKEIFQMEKTESQKA